ncbi:Rft protein-domain-containing protein [Aspergillus crustosus]
MSQAATEPNNMLVPAVSGTAMLICVQLASRLFIFASNQMILRSLSPSTLGIAAQVDLFLISIIYFSRESIRAAIQRQPVQSSSATSITLQDTVSSSDKSKTETQATSSQSIVNMSYLSIVMGFVVSLTSVALYLHFVSIEVSETAYYRASVAVTAAAALIELGSEPFFAVLQHYMLYSKRAAVEISAAFFKNLITSGVSMWAAWGGHSLGALPFALGHLSYSLILFGGYYLAAIYQSSSWHFSLLPLPIKPSDKSAYFADRFPRHLLSLSANVFIQSVVKHLLTQGDSLILAAMTNLQDQGIYSLASNYGGLLARILLQPIEESSRNIFSSLLSSREGRSRDANIGTAKALLLNIMRAYMVMLVLIIPLGPTLAPSVLHFLGGPRWTAPEVSDLLALYCYYVPFLAFNGICEAFVSSTASPAQLRKQAAWMALFSALFVLTAYIFLSIGGLGARGLVYANIVNMSARIIWSFSFIKQYLHQNKFDLELQEFALRPQTYTAGAIVTALLSVSKSNVEPYMASKPFIIGAFYVLIVLYCEREHIMTHYDKIYRFMKAKEPRAKTK